jgi:hypothetical protein
MSGFITAFSKESDDIKVVCCLREDRSLLIEISKKKRDDDDYVYIEQSSIVIDGKDTEKLKDFLNG